MKKTRIRIYYEYSDPDLEPSKQSVCRPNKAITYTYIHGVLTVINLGCIYIYDSMVKQNSRKEITAAKKKLNVFI